MAPIPTARPLKRRVVRVLEVKAMILKGGAERFFCVSPFRKDDASFVAIRRPTAASDLFSAPMIVN